MVERLLEFYKHNVTSYGLVFRHLWWAYYGVPSLLVVGLVATAVINRGSLLADSAHLAWHGLLVPLFLAVALTILLNQKAKELVRRKYGISGGRFLWRSVGFEDYQLSQLIQYLEIHELLSERKIQVLVRLLGEEAKRSRIPPYVAPGVLLALFLPVWSVLVDKLSHRIDGIDFSWPELLALPIGLYLLIRLLGETKSIFTEFRDAYFPTRGAHLIELSCLLEKCLLRLP